LKILKKVRTASLNSGFTGSYKKSVALQTGFFISLYTALKRFNDMVSVRQSWSLGQNLRDRDETLTFRYRDFDVPRPRLWEKVETRPKLERTETETRHETFNQTTYLQNITKLLTLNFGQWTFW